MLRYKILSKIIVFAVVLLLPAMVYAQTTIRGLVDGFGYFVGRLIPIVAGIALLVFFWGLVKFIWGAGSDASREQGRQVMLWGIVALFVLTSIWGILTFLRVNFLGYGQGGGSLPPPCLEGLGECAGGGDTSRPSECELNPFLDYC